MRSYGFWCIDGKNRPHHTIDAEDDQDFYKKLDVFLVEKGFELDRTPGLISWSETGTIAMPPPNSQGGSASLKILPEDPERGQAFMEHCLSPDLR